MNKALVLELEKVKEGPVQLMLTNGIPEEEEETNKPQLSLKYDAEEEQRERRN